jgi:hypothetical protein
MVHAGGVERLRELLGQHPGLASARIVDDKGGSATALHAATDWPGFFARGPEVVAVLIEAGADPNAPWRGAGTPRPRCTGRLAATTSRWNCHHRGTARGDGQGGAGPKSKPGHEKLDFCNTSSGGGHPGRERSEHS